MIISRLELSNWRNFRKADVELRDRVFVVGPNAAGKSNLLEAIRFLRDIAKPGGGLQWAIQQRHGLSKIRCLSARKDPDVEIAVELSDGGPRPSWRYEIGITQQVRGYRHPFLRYERVWKDGKPILKRPDKDDAVDDFRLTQTHLEQISANSGFREVARLLESVRYLHLVPQVLKYPEAFSAGQSMEDYFGRSLLETVAKTPEKTRRGRLRRIEAALREAVPQLKGLTEGGASMADVALPRQWVRLSEENNWRLEQRREGRHMADRDRSGSKRVPRDASPQLAEGAPTSKPAVSGCSARGGVLAACRRFEPCEIPSHPRCPHAAASRRIG